MNIVERLKDSLEYEYNLSFYDRKHLLEEINRLNNIIDEYRNHLIKKMNEFVIYDGDLSKIYEEEFDYLDKLKELKENK